MTRRRSLSTEFPRAAASQLAATNLPIGPGLIARYRGSRLGTTTQLGGLVKKFEEVTEISPDGARCEAVCYADLPAGELRYWLVPAARGRGSRAPPFD